MKLKATTMALIALFCSMHVLAAVSEKSVHLDRSFKTVSGYAQHADRQTSVAGHLYDWYTVVNNRATFDVTGWDYFTVSVGIVDGTPYERSATIEVDGETKWQGKLKPNAEAYSITIPLSGRRALTLTVPGNTYYVVFAEPTLHKGTTPGVASGNALSVNRQSCVDLAKTLATKIRASSGASGSKTIAVARFQLIGPDDSHKPANAVAESVREDITTALADYDWLNVVERSQLDKSIESLKLDQSGYIDSDTAKKLGRMVSADYVLIGSISERPKFVVLNARVIDVETARVKCSASAEVNK